MLLHMTATRWNPRANTFTAYCRCTWVGDEFPTRAQARTDGDAHLCEAHKKKEPVDATA